MTPDLQQQIAQFCHKYALLAPNDAVLVGVSGGPDSLCLLHVLHALSQTLHFSVSIAHLNHQLRGADSDADAAFAQDIANSWQLPIYIENRDVTTLAGQRKQSIEETARQVRYAFLWQVAAKTGANKIAVGHHADDQVETILMHFLRGSGLAGLRGMLPVTNLATLRLYPTDIEHLPGSPSPQLIRPLLNISRPAIEAYCAEQGLAPRRDASNQDTTFFRNRLRHELIPYLESFNPNIRQVIRHTASVVAADVEILTKQLDAVWGSVLQEQWPESLVFNLPAWLKLPAGLKRSTLRRAVHRLRRSLRDINFIHLEQAIEIVETGTTGAKATLPQGLILTVGYETFTIAGAHATTRPVTPNQPQLPVGQVIKLNLPGITSDPAVGWRLKAQLVSAPTPNFQEISKWEAYLDADVVGADVWLRTRRPGDTFQPLGLGGHHKKINEFMINEKIPAHRRNSIPVLVNNQQILWLCGYRVDERARVQPRTKKILHLKFEQF